MTIQTAIRKLRGKESQQAFSSRLGYSIRSQALYESNRIPEPRQLYKLLLEAKRIGRQDLADVLAKAFNEQIGHTVIGVE